jgi:hypothetical protein
MGRKIIRQSKEYLYLRKSCEQLRQWNSVVLDRRSKYEVVTGVSLLMWKCVLSFKRFSLGDEFCVRKQQVFNHVTALHIYFKLGDFNIKLWRGKAFKTATRG